MKFFYLPDYRWESLRAAVCVCRYKTDRIIRREGVLRKVTDKNYDEIIGGSDVAVLCFVSAWCATCKSLEQIIEGPLSDKNSLVLMARADISEAPEVAQKFGVLGIPTVVFLRNGKPVHQVTFTGVVSKEKISQMIRKHLNV